MQEIVALSNLVRQQPVSELVRDAYDRRARQLWSYGRRLGLDGEAAEDVMQEAFIRLLDKPSRSIDNLDAWLFRVVHNLAIDHLRRARSRNGSPAIRTISSAADEDRIALWAAVDDLPERQRAVVYLRYRADLEFRAIGHILGIGEGGARANCARALESLRKRW